MQKSIRTGHSRRSFKSKVSWCDCRWGSCPVCESEGHVPRGVVEREPQPQQEGECPEMGTAGRVHLHPLSGDL